MSIAQESYSYQGPRFFLKDPTVMITIGEILNFLDKFSYNEIFTLKIMQIGGQLIQDVTGEDLWITRKFAEYDIELK